MSDMFFANSADPRDLLTRAHNRGHRHAFLPFWITLLTQVPSFSTRAPRVFEYGSVSPMFSCVARDATGTTHCDGVSLDCDAPPQPLPPTPNPSHDFTQLSEEGFRNSHFTYDLGFSYELLSVTEKVRVHAELMHSKLRTGGAYYTSLCWHTGNPNADRFVSIRKAKGRPVHLHSIDEIAIAFHAAGFEVGVKRLPIDFFLIFDPTSGSERYGSVSGMLSTWHADSVLFSFRKHTTC